MKTATQPLQLCNLHLIGEHTRPRVLRTMQLEWGARPSRSQPSASRRWRSARGLRSHRYGFCALSLVGETPTSAGETPALPDNELNSLGLAKAAPT
jgi:hypothetical protein